MIAWEAYQQFADILYKILDAAGTKKFDSELSKIIRRLRKFLSQLWVVESDDVVRAAQDWFMCSNRGKEENETLPMDLSI